MRQTIKDIISLIRSNIECSFTNLYPYFGIIDDRGILRDRIIIDNKYCYYYDEEYRCLFVQNYETGKTRKFKI